MLIASDFELCAETVAIGVLEVMPGPIGTPDDACVETGAVVCTIAELLALEITALRIST